MSMQALGIGVIGTNFGANVHVPALRMIEGVDVRAIAGHDEQKTRMIAQKLGIPQSYADVRAMITDPSIAAICVASPPQTHANIIKAAAAAGKHVLCEKPFCLNSLEAKAARDQIIKAGVIGMIDFEFRDHPAFQALWRAVRSEEFEKLRQVDIRWAVGSWADPLRLWGWQCSRDARGGILGALVVHLLDYVEWLFGPINRLSAQLSTAISQRVDSLGTVQEVDVPDGCHILLVTKEGIPITCSVSNVAPCGTGHRIECHGAKKSMIIENPNVLDYAKGFRAFAGPLGASSFTDVPLDTRIIDAQKDGRIGPVAALAKRFMDAVRTGKQDEPSFATGVRTQVLLEAIEKADTKKQWVDTPMV